MKKLIAALTAVGIMAGDSEAQSPAAVMERAVKAYADMRSMKASFTQSISNPLTGTKATSRGMLLRKDPNLLSINFSDPRGDRIVADGKSLWVYLPSSAPGQVIKMPATTSNSLAMVDPGGIFLSSPSSRYAITGAGTATVAGRKANVVNLVPKRPNNTFTRAKVWVDASDNSIRQFEVIDANGLTRMVTITSIEKNPEIAASAFRFLPPKSTRVLDSSALSGL